jgi:DNA-binding transcriptional regulator YdaS (Cro superfamily)
VPRPRDYLLIACIHVNDGQIRGAKAAMAQHFGLSRAAISNWFEHGVPASKVDKVCEACGDIVQVHQLRPDRFRSNRNNRSLEAH